MNIDSIIGHSTPEELVELTKACLVNLTDEQLYDVLNDTISNNNKRELSAMWETF